jgi:hypothetical protein
MPYGTLNIGCNEHLDPAGTGSFYNEGEADIVTQQVLNLVHCGICASSGCFIMLFFAVLSVLLIIL